MAYTQITPAQDWFFRHPGLRPEDPPIVYQVAAWALKAPNSEGHTEVVGLIAPIFPGDASRKLHEPPPVEGGYLHRDQLDQQELAQLKKR